MPEGKPFEWSMGNGQCPCCHGCGPVFKGHIAEPKIGHKEGCELAQLMNDAGKLPMMEQINGR